MCSLLICGAADRSRGVLLAACLALAGLLGGCGSRDLGPEEPLTPPPPAVPTRGAPVDAAAAHILDAAPAGARLDYRLPDGRTAVFSLGAVYQSGLQAPCRLGKTRAAGSQSGSPAAYPFCRYGAQWYAMPPVVVSGF